ncbi:hypothetical protein QTH49_13330 [Clostridium perfringens]|nr:hypothetical protein [Clostridium perfringens]
MKLDDIREVTLKKTIRIEDYKMSMDYDGFIRNQLLKDIVYELSSYIYDYLTNIDSLGLTEFTTTIDSQGRKIGAEISLINHRDLLNMKAEILRLTKENKELSERLENYADFKISDVLEIKEKLDLTIKFSEELNKLCEKYSIYMEG